MRTTWPPVCGKPPDGTVDVVAGIDDVLVDGSDVVVTTIVVVVVVGITVKA